MSCNIYLVNLGYTICQERPANIPFILVVDAIHHEKPSHILRCPRSTVAQGDMIVQVLSNWQTLEMVACL